MLEADETEQQHKDENVAENGCTIHSPSSTIPKHYRLLDATDLDQLQNVYPKIVSEIFELISQLRNSQIEWRKFRNEEKRIMVLLCSIRQLIKVKNSIFLLHGLQPSLFSLFFELLPLADRWILTFLPDFHYLVLKMAKEFVQTHDHFFHNCEVFQPGFSDKYQSSSGTTTSSFSSGVTGKYFTKIIGSVAELSCFFNILSNHAQKTLIDWLSKLSNLIVEKFKAVSELREMFVLRSSLLLGPFFALYSIKSLELRKNLVKCMYRIQMFNVLISDDPLCKALSRQFNAKLFECAEHLEVEQFRTLWNRIPIAYLIRIFGVSENYSIGQEEAIPKKTQMVFGKMCMGPNEFSFVSDFLFERKRIALLQESSAPQNWLFVSGEYLFESLSNIPSKIEEPNKNSTFDENCFKQKSQINDDTSLLQKWLFIIGQLAHYCAVNRMKTPIGKTPLETFTKFENQLRALASSSISQMVESRSKGITSSYNDELISHENVQKSEEQSDDYCGEERQNLYPEEEWFRVRMLLHCIDMVEKMMCYAVRGSMLKIYADLPLNARQFFSVNFNTCMDWLSRTALPLMSTAYANGHYTQIIRFGGFIFAEFERKLSSLPSNDAKIRLDSSMQLALTWVIRALVRLGAPQAIRGVRMFCETTFGPSNDFSWCHSAELLASARVEESLDGFLNFINCAKQSKENAPKVHDHVLNAIDELALMAVGILRLPQADSKIREAFIDRQDIKDNASGESGTKMFGKFSRKSWDSVLKLSSWDQLAPNATSFSLPSQNQLTTESKNESWALRNRLLETETKILQIFEIRQKNASVRQNTSELLFSLQDELSDLAQFLLLGGHEHTDGLVHSKLAILHSICTGIQHLNMPNQHHHHPTQHLQHFSPKGQQLQQHGKQMMRSPTKYAVSTPILLEVDFADLLHNYKSNALHRLEIGQMYCGWMHRLYGAQKEHSSVLKKMHWQIAQLAQDLGNPQLANTHLRLAVQSGVTNSMPWTGDNLYSNQMHHQLNILPDYHQFNMGFSNLHIQQQIQPQFQSVPPGFELFVHPKQHYHNNDAQNQFVGNNISFSCPPTPQVTKTLLSEDFDGDSLRLLPNELVTMQQFGIDIDSPQGRHLEELIGRCSTYEEFRCQIIEHFPLTNVSMQSSAILMALDQSNFNQFWLSIKHRQYRLYELALNSHLRFLENLSSEKSYVQTVEVILRFLKMLSRQPEWFERIVSFSADNGPSVGTKSSSAWMDQIPVNIWIGMVPQLFAYLNHPKSVVVDTISLLLQQIGQNLPHVICFSAIVIAGASDENAKRMPLPSDQSKDKGENFMINSSIACKSLIDSLAAKYPDLVRDTTDFCRSLQRIALLHEEQWLYTLTQFDHQIGRLLRSALPLSDASVGANLLPNGRSSPQCDGRLREYMEQVFKSLKYLEKVTCKEKGESENERQFVLIFGEQIQSALETLEQNKFNDPRKAWDPFRTLIAGLNKQALKKTSLCLNISKISTHLGELSATSVPVPGQEMLTFEQAVTVHKMDRVAFVLPTKTRPKKLSLIGSDGKTYTFLFKGQENLYMDTRLMQLLRMCNAIFDDVKNQLPMDINPAYHCVTYAVTPLGRRSGLIKWVDGAIPLFQIYRKWRIRQLQFNAENEENKQQKMIGVGGQNKQFQRAIGKESGRMVRSAFIVGKKTSNERGKELEPERPMEQFTNKLKAIFLANRVPKGHLNDRKYWPKEMLKKVLKELMDETPKDILAKEIWVHSGTSDVWWMNTQNFARTAAVSSMLGALIGLGDRHLDNVLVDLHSGQIVHVDYNICFGKGRILRVPEMVPFRLTENIRTALGPTKCEGIFRQSSERVVEMLRADKHLLLQLLETLKFDPMLDLSFLQGNAELRIKNRHQLVDYVVQEIGRKLTGFELKRRHNISSRKSPGLINLEGETSKSDGKEPTGENEWEEVGTANVSEQVNLLIQEATDWDNLSLMYEGWTAWV